METEVQVEGNDEGNFREARLGKITHSSSSPQNVTNPVVYKLVRVEGDGRLVPATDDEVMEVEGLFAEGKNKMHNAPDNGQRVACTLNERSSSGMPQLASLEGLLHTQKTDVYGDELSARLEEPVCSLSPSLTESHIDQSQSVVECPNPPDKQIEGGPSTSATVTSSMPDFSKLQGEMCLDNLSIKELHETFRATFGRETTVKDKQWLKRRIAMGLTNSCDVLSTSFVIKDNKLVKKINEESYNNVGGTGAEDVPIRAINDKQKNLSINHGGDLEDHNMASNNSVRNHIVDGHHASDEHCIDQRATKRIRKPTRRYIEELSEAEAKFSSGRLMTSEKNSGLGQLSQNLDVKSADSASSDRRMVITRLVSLGGTGIMVPCVSRIRRSRPRKNFTALLRFNPARRGVSATVVRKALGIHSFQPNNVGGNKIMIARSTLEQLQPQLVALLDREKQLPTSGVTGVEHNVESKHVDSSGYPDENTVTVPTSKGGIRRKHHRAWTLSEVVKLVEGVSRYGAGRWSEIKRLAFASYSYRTSVDLKDKWRNLLKASLAQTPSDKKINPRKSAAALPIPTPILLRVRELAQMQAQVPPNLSSSNKVTGSTDTSVNERQPGYL
uniref:Uncharacterized protein n=2 Tax=Rhizophora mucronata TaxID=61149 RepID=A0A2P2LD94_RHIMU